jgi:hypothetical protein
MESYQMTNIVNTEIKASISVEVSNPHVIINLASAFDAFDRKDCPDSIILDGDHFSNDENAFIKLCSIIDIEPNEESREALQEKMLLSFYY